MKEFWGSRLHRHGETRCRYIKLLTHRRERRDARITIRVGFFDNLVKFASF